MVKWVVLILVVLAVLVLVKKCGGGCSAKK